MLISRLPHPCHWEQTLPPYSSQLKKPSLSKGSTPLYWQSPPQLEESTRPNLSKTLGELLADGETDILLTDANLPFQLNLSVTVS